MSAAVRRWWPAALLTALAALIYGSTLDAPFIFDDYPSIVENDRIRSLWPPHAPFLVEAETPFSSRPIPQWVTAINYAISGEDVWSYHLFNLAMHIGCVLLVWRLVERVLTLKRESLGLAPHDAPALAVVIAAIWSVHPINSETVIYITQRTELLVSLALLGMLVSFLRAHDDGITDRQRRRWLIVSIVCCWLGVACKENMVGAPLLALLLDRAVLSQSFAAALRVRWRYYLACLASWTLLAVLIVASPRSGSAGFGLAVSPLEYLTAQAGVLLMYLRLTFVPWPLSVAYHVPVPTSVLEAFPEAFVVLALLALTAWGLWRNRTIGLAGAWFFVLLAPTSSFIPIPTEMAAERRMYLPVLAVIAVVVVVAWRLLGRLEVMQRRTAGLGAAAAITVLMASVTGVRGQVFRSDLRLFQDAVATHPMSHHAHGGLARAYRSRGEMDLWFEHLGRMVEIWPYLPEATLQYAGELGRRGRWEESLRWLDVVVKYAKPKGIVHVNRGVALAQLGRDDEALAAFRKAIEIEPDLPEAWMNVGVNLARRGQLEEARTHVAEAVRLNPESGPAQQVLRTIDSMIVAGRQSP